MTNCVVRVLDANDAPVAGALVTGAGQTGVTDPDGRCSVVVADPAAVATWTVSHPYYAPENVAFAGDLRTEPGNNPLVSRTVSGTDVNLTVHLGRLDTCPTVELTSDQVDRLMTTKDRDPHAARVFHPPRFSSTRAYVGHWNQAWTIQRAQPELLAEKAPPAQPNGWARFAHEAVDNVDPAALGRFYWLEYPSRPADPKFAVAVWSPNLANAKPLETLDFVLFYSPHTGDYTATYPYGMIDKSAPFQQYFDLGKKYLLDEFFFAYQLIARRNRSVLVMPICQHGEWGPFASGEGALRLLREVSVFLHRQARTSSAGVRPPTAGPDELAGPNLRSFGTSITAADFGPVPGVGKVAVAAFSTGVVPLKSVMSDRNWATSYGSTLWGAPGGIGTDPRTAWATAWRELWDLDGFHPKTGGWTNYLDLLKPWFGRDTTRVLRSYHSSGRVPPDPLTDAHPVWKDLRAGGLSVDRPSPPTTGALWARVLQNARWTSLRMSDSYIEGNPGGELPLFLDAHHSTPRLGFSHAVAMTSVGRV